MSKYVVINTDGTNAFYDSDIHSTIPDEALEISDTDYKTFFSDQSKYYFTNNSGTATLGTYSTKYCYSDYGLTSKEVKNTYTAATGEVLFDTEPTTTELETAFPSTAGSRTYTITTNGGDTAAVTGSITHTIAGIVSGDIVAVDSVSLTAGTGFTVGTTDALTAANIVTALNANSTFNALYTATSSENIITITEKTAGGGNTPTTMTITGTGTVTNGTAVTSTAKVTGAVTVCGVKLTCGTNYVVGTTATDTATNIVNALNANSTFAALYKATSSNATFTITEIFAGDGNTPTAVAYAGAIVISSDTATTSTKGYTTANKLASLALIDSQYQTYGQQYDRAYVAALTNSDLTDTEKTTNTANIISAKKSLTTWRTSERELIING